MIETHPYLPFIQQDTEILIVGTSPPLRFSRNLPLYDQDVDFYYGSKVNLFWRLMGDLFEIEFIKENTQEAIQQRKDFLIQYKIGHADTVKKFIRKENNSLDQNLEVLEILNFEEIFNTYPTIKQLFFTGYSAKVSPEKLFMKYLKEKEVNVAKISEKPNQFQFEWKDRMIKTHSLYSPSPAVRKKYEEVLANYRVLRSVNYEL